MSTDAEKDYRLEPPFDHYVITFPYAWAQPGRLRVLNERSMEGTVYSPEWARALAEGILKALDG